MRKKKKDNSDYEIDRELTGKFAIVKNAEYQDRIEQLEEENKKLKDKIKHLEFDVDAWHQLKLLLEGEIERLKETIKDHQLYEDKLEQFLLDNIKIDD